MRFGYTKHKEKDVVETLDNIYCGIFINYPNFKEGDIKTLVYDFSCPEYKELIFKYHIDQVVGKGSDFLRAKRLLKNLSP